MAVSLRALVELILLGPAGNRRLLQDSPVLGDVWMAYASKPFEPQDLLITPASNQPAGPLASAIMKEINDNKLKIERGAEEFADIAYLHGFVVAHLYFREILVVIVPKTIWWGGDEIQEGLKSFTKEDFRLKVEKVIQWIQAGDESLQSTLVHDFDGFTAWDRYVMLAGIILWAGENEELTDSKSFFGDLIAKASGSESVAEEISEEVQKLLRDIKEYSSSKGTKVWQVSLNRKVMPALDKSVLAVKGDAAKSLFNVRCDGITWAVIDCGIDAGHPVFLDEKDNNRVVKAYDFSNIRKIISLDNLDTTTDQFKNRLEELLKGHEELTEKEATEILEELANDADNDRPIYWEAVEKLIEIKTPKKTPPSGGHGTHVAGIIGAKAPDKVNAKSVSYKDGMCPDIHLYDFRVLANSIKDTEFAVIAALQFIRYLNERNAYISVHGVNLSLSIPHDVRNYACGRTPVCIECEHLVESGVVVVAAAGNFGYQSFKIGDGTSEGFYEGYAAFSITDPGNADSVITVGATHRYKPHTYGVSFFSSRGPTGDGRLKPDLVAPGERIQSCLPDEKWGQLDGTSMAAPHVSGAAAMLMARYPELIGNPRKIKKILCESATDLGRERSFQGHGMLDVLRAFQSI